MLTLTLLRHAKSSWGDPDLDDHERPLSKRGAGDAPRMGRWLARQWREMAAPAPVIVCSDAVRTRATLALILPELDLIAPKVKIEPSLYLAEPATILALLQALAPATRHALVIAHNPGLHMLALDLTGSGHRREIAPLSMDFPTCGAALFTFEADSFAEIGSRRGRLTVFMTPKRLG